MPDADAVLTANATFYAAFATADIEAMALVWASDGPVCVIHPGSLPLAGRAQVLQSWREIFQSAPAVDIVCIDPHVQIHGDVAVVVCREHVNGHILAASNTYRRSAEGWSLVMHQAGSVAPALAPARSSVVH